MKAVLYTDGGARGNPGPAGVGFVLLQEEKESIKYNKYIGRATNNQAEYEALLAGLKRAIEEGIHELEVRMDSELIVKQMGGKYRVKNAGLRPLFDKTQELVEAFEKVSFKHVPRGRNKEADRLVNEAIDSASK